MVLGYDLGYYPITYDFAYWLVRAEEARIQHDRPSLHIVFQPGKDDGFRLKTARDFQLSTARKRWRLENLLAPLAYRIQSVSAVTILPERADVDTPHFNIFDEIHKHALEPFSASDAAKAAIRAMFPKRYVVMTVRASDIQPERNSRISEWLKVSKWLGKRGFHVVFVPDTEAVLLGRQSGLPNECIPAALNVDLRLALYELAQFCLFTSGGPMALVQYARNVNYATFALVCEDIPTCGPQHLENIGLCDGDSRGTHRHSWWCKDTFENVTAKLVSKGYLDIQKNTAVESVLNAQTHFRGHLITPKVPHEHSQIRST